MNEIKKFVKERTQDIKLMNKDKDFKSLSNKWLAKSVKYKYNYNFSWMGRPVIRYPNDLVVLQELFWQIKPDLVIETGIAHGGSLIFNASMLKMMEIKKFKIVGIDIEIRKHNQKLIKKHPMYKYITMIEGDSNDHKILSRLKRISKSKKRVMVILDSDHSYKHVKKELQNYSQFVTKNSYLITPDTYIDFLPKNTFSKWKVGDNTYTAVKEFLKTSKNFKLDVEINKKTMISEAINGYMKRIK